MLVLVCMNISECSTYDETTQILCELCVKLNNEIYAQHLLASRRQQPRESLDEFLQALKQLPEDWNYCVVTAGRRRRISERCIY